MTGAIGPDRIRSRSRAEPFRPDAPALRNSRRRPRATICSARDILDAARRRGWPIDEIADELFDLQLHLGPRSPTRDPGAPSDRGVPDSGLRVAVADQGARVFDGSKLKIPGGGGVIREEPYGDV